MLNRLTIATLGLILFTACGAEPEPSELSAWKWPKKDRPHEQSKHQIGYGFVLENHDRDYARCNFEFEMKVKHRHKKAKTDRLEHKVGVPVFRGETKTFEFSFEKHLQQGQWKPTDDIYYFYSCGAEVIDSYPIYE